MAKRIWKSRAFFIQADTRGSLAILLCLALILCIFAGFGESFAQGIHHPFAVGANEGAIGGTTGLRGWILAQESGFYRMLTGAIRAAKENGAAAWVLAGLSFVYGIFHAAGPGHGKAVIASYMLANEKALWRGLVISLCAALMQALVAIGIVGIAALILRATAGEMTEAAHWLEIASYTGIVALGAALVVSKGMALLAALRMASMPVKLAFAAPRPEPAGAPRRAFSAEACDVNHVHGPQCGHFHAPDPQTLDQGFAWKTALLTVLTAGSRPCSGAILVLVFALAQGIFLAGIGATLAMSLGTAVTTGTLAGFAVFAKGLAVRISGASSARALILGRLFEVGAGLTVLVLGLALLMATLAHGPSNA